VNGRFKPTYLDLQQIIAANALVVHLVVGVISVPAALVLDKGEAEWLIEYMAKRSSRSEGVTYSLLEAERGAGMSQRTRRP
jgi:hypothetical protein